MEEADKNAAVEPPTNHQTIAIDEKTDILALTINEFGKWQLRVSLLMALLKIPVAWFQIGNVLMAPDPSFHCVRPDTVDISETDWRAIYEKNHMDPCRYPETINDTWIKDFDVYIKGKCRDGFVFNTETFKSTIITEWDLVCDRGSYADLSQFILMVGVLIGSVTFGVLGDKLGRRKVLIGTILLQTIFSVLLAALPWFWAFNTVRFLLGFANGGVAIISFVTCMEAVSGKYRTTIPILYQIPFGVGTTLMGLISYVTRDWRQTQWILSALCCLFLIYCWLSDESPRWLLVTKQHDKAIEMLERIAKTNNITDGRNIREIIMDDVKRKEKDTMESNNKSNIGSLFASSKLRQRVFLVYINWFLNGVLFFSVTLSLSRAGTNPWLTVASSGLVIIPGALLTTVLLGKLGRKPSLMGANILASVCLITLEYIPWDRQTLRLAIILFIVICLTVSQTGLFLYTGELFPTIVRNFGIGSSVMFSRIGSLCAPFMFVWCSRSDAPSDNITATVLDWIMSPPLFVVLGVMAIIIALLFAPLPETRNKPLPDTIEDAL